MCWLRYSQAAKMLSKYCKVWFDQKAVPFDVMGHKFTLIESSVEKLGNPILYIKKCMV